MSARILDFNNPDYQELCRTLSLGMLNGPYIMDCGEDGTILYLSQVVQEILNSDWLRDVRHQAWLQGFQAGEEDVLHHEATSFDEPCLANAKSPYAPEHSDAV